MKCVILAGGVGSRIAEESQARPKPMIEIGNKPILWHVLKIYSGHGIRDFVICTGYRGFMIKEYFANYFLHSSDVTFRMADNRMEVHAFYELPCGCQKHHPLTLDNIDLHYTKNPVLCEQISKRGLYNS